MKDGTTENDFDSRSDSYAMWGETLRRPARTER